MVAPLSVPGCGCLWLLEDMCGFFCGRVVPEARTGRVFSTLLVVCCAGLWFRLGCFGDFRFLLLPPGGHSPGLLSCSLVFGCRFGFFLRGTLCLRGFVEAHFLLGCCRVGTSTCSGFFCFDRRDLNQLCTERNYRRIILDVVPKLGLVRV